MKAEKDIINEILLRASMRGHRLFRQNVGRGYVGSVRRLPGEGHVEITNARPFIAGLCVGSSDIIGYSCQGKFVALEVKTKTVRATAEQKAFIAAALKAGCIAGVVFSADEAMALLDAGLRPSP